MCFRGMVIAAFIENHHYEINFVRYRAYFSHWLGIRSICVYHRLYYSYFTCIGYHFPAIGYYPSKLIYFHYRPFQHGIITGL
jgi:hypothetical protein